MKVHVNGNYQETDHLQAAGDKSNVLRRICYMLMSLLMFTNGCSDAKGQSLSDVDQRPMIACSDVY